ncbi:MAG: TonB-dependent receptor [Bacteroidota bacterium]|nr:TonB-dependent receptor [Bacteroidota bacterium]
MLLWGLTCAPFFSTAQQVKITDITTMEPLENVMIIRKNPDVIRISNVKGQADISEFKDADTIVIERIGYQRKIVSFQKLVAAGFTTELYPASYSLGEILIAASRFEEKREDIPVQIASISASEIKNSNQQTTADLLQHTGNIMVQKSQAGGGSPIIRGFEANKVLIVMDGVRMNNAIYRGGHLQNVISVDQFGLEKLEIIFGPGSVVYGSDALGGVMHFYTRKPVRASRDSGLDVNGSAFTRFSSANTEMSAGMLLNIGAKNFASLTSVSLSRFGDLRAGKNRNPAYGDWGRRDFVQDFINNSDTMVRNDDYTIQKYSGYDQVGVMQKFLFSRNDSVSHILNFQFTTTNDIPRYDRLTEVDDNGVFTSAEWYYGPQTRIHTAYEFKYGFSHRLFDHLSVIAAWQHILESRHNRRFGNSNLLHREELLDIFSINIDFEKRIRKHELRYGTEISYNNLNSTAYAENIFTGIPSPLDTRYPDGGSEIKAGGVYVTHTYEFNKKYILTSGLRYSLHLLDATFDDTTFYKIPVREVSQRSGALSGSLGLIYMPGFDWRFRIIGSTGFRAPNVDDLAKIFESQQGEVIVPNPDLKPEYTYNAEVGISKMIFDQLFVEGTAWYTLYREAITIGDFTFNGNDSILYDGTLSRVKANINAGEAYLYGFSASLNADLSQVISLQSSVNYTYGRIKTDSLDYPLDHIPPVIGKTALNVSIQKFKGSFYLIYHGFKKIRDYNLVGEDNIDNATPFGTPDWMTLNVSGNYTLHKNISLQLAIENILDKHYRVFASGISAPGRNFIIALRGTF